MDVSQLLYGESDAQQGDTPKPVHGYPTRRSSYVLSGDHPEIDTLVPGLNAFGSLHNGSLTGGRRKLVTFRLVLSDNAQQTARLPLKVYVSPHDTTDSIISTTKNFYGLYEGQGISFEDDKGVALIAQYENLGHNSTVFVRVRDERPPSTLMQRPVASAPVGSPAKPWLDEPIQLQPPPPLRTTSPSKIHMSGSFRGLSLPKNNDDAANGLSDSDAGSVSVSSSRRAKSDGLASAEISLENIVEGGRRKRAKFESSELPLFIPPQVPITASMSSASPQRKILGANMGSPYNNQSGFSYGNVLPSPQSNGRVDIAGSIPGAMPAPYAPGHRLRGRSSGTQQVSRFSGGAVLPTPDPTIGGSVISDEDVALQLMRLGDPGNFSHGRLSNSTMDETLSGKAEAASSSVENSDAESELDELDQEQYARYHGHNAGPARKKFKGLSHAGAQGYYSDDSSEYDYHDHSHHPLKVPKSRRGSITSKTGRQRTSSKSKHHDGSSKLPPSPHSMDHRKGSTESNGAIHQHFADDEEDLSSRPRCQRCRKSKKGCDRQRPCGRCKDAGIGIEGCISEDEGNGRKGRYGRHMGVPVKKDSIDAGSPIDHLPSLSTYGIVGIDASKKRKR